VRVLVISDIHGNWPAIEVVSAVPHDEVLCVGDIVGYGPDPAKCLRWLRARSAHIVQGNHDRALAEGIPPRCRPDFEWLAAAAAGIGRAQLSDEERLFLRALPGQLSLVLDGKRILMLHAAPADPVYGYLRSDASTWREAAAGLAADFLLVGHTHVPFQHEFETLQVVNPGSLGQPKDGDPRACYAIIEDGVALLERIPYPVETTVEGLRDSGIDDEAFHVLAGLLRTGRVSRIDAKGGGRG